MSFIWFLKNEYPSREIDSIFYLLLTFYKKWSKVDYTLNKNDFLNNDDFHFLNISLKKLANGVPVQHITHSAYFFDMDLFVNENVLIPRPETEELVHHVFIQNKTNDSLSIVDIGTGSGCIILALKKLFPNSICYAIDDSIDALDIATQNALKFNLDISFHCMDILNENLPINSCDIIVSNPPYIPFSQRDSMSRNVVEHEPHKSLFVKDEKPLIFYNKIAEIGKKVLALMVKFTLKFTKNMQIKLYIY